LEEAEKLKDLARLGGDLVDTVIELATEARNASKDALLPLDADDEDQLGLSGHVERTILLGDPVQADLLALSIAILLDVLLSTLEDNAALLLVGL
jgi:hypothetical protein